MKNFKKILIVCLSLSSLYICSSDIIHAQGATSDRVYPAGQLNIRITKDNFTDFRESLILNLHDENILMNSLYSANFNFKQASASRIDMISSLRKAPILNSYQNKAQRKQTTGDNPPNIYNINLGSSGNSIGASEKFSNNSRISAISISQDRYNDLSTLQLMDKSKESIRSRKKAEAQSYLDSAVIKAGRNSWSLAEIADNYEQIKSYDKANKVWEKALALNPNRIELLYSYALYLCRNNQSEKAYKYLNKITSINPQFMLAYYNLGNIYFKKGQYLSAVKSYSKAISINPYCEDAFYNLALSLEALNQKSLALNYYKACLKLNPADNQVKLAIKRLKKQ